MFFITLKTETNCWSHPSPLWKRAGVCSKAQTEEEEVFHPNGDSLKINDQNRTEYISSPNPPKTSSVGFNVFVNGDSRPNSVDHYCTPNIFRSSSVGTSDLVRLDTPLFTRIPLENSPLMSFYEDASPSSYEGPRRNNECSFKITNQEENYGSVSLRRRKKKIDYALYHRTGSK